MSDLTKMTIEAIQSNTLKPFESDGIAHGFYTRNGGVSSGIYGSLNTGLGSNDETALVLENRARIAADLGIASSHLAGCYQIHSADIVTVTEPIGGERPKADGMVTNVRGLALGILTADCGPIIFADPKAQVIGACHAGWQGALVGIGENTIDAMIALGAKRQHITAVLGPCISQKNYEVGAEFEARFRSYDPSFSKFFIPSQKQQHFQFDLQGFIIARLIAAGINATKTSHCTYADERRFFSYRRTTHRKEPDYGRQMSAIALL